MESNYSIGCFQWFFNVRHSITGCYTMLTTSIPLKVYSAPESLPSPLCAVSASPPRADKHLHGKAISAVSPWIPMSHRLSWLSCSHTPKKSQGRHQPRQICPPRLKWERSWASPTVLAVKYILDWEVSQFRIDTQPQYTHIQWRNCRELTARLHLHHKPVRNAKPHDGSCQMMGLVFSLRSSMTSLYSYIMVYIHAVVQWEETSVLSLSYVLSQTVHGECFPQKRRVKGQSAVLRNIKNIPSSCTGFPQLSSSWLVTSTQRRQE